MDLSLKWLRDFVDLPQMPPKKYCEALTMSGSKVEGYTQEGADIKNVVVGRVDTMKHHPDSDHLWICQIDVGGEITQIITGAQNVQVGDFVPVAKHNSLLPNGVKITKGKLRGVESCGMLCSLGELGLTIHDFPYAIEDGIFILGEDCSHTPGQDIQSAIGLDDLKVEFEITSNRPDCLSVIGLARETAATFGLPLTIPQPVVHGYNDGDTIENYLHVEVQNKNSCPRYMAAVVKNIKIGPSPRWMRERLRTSGIRPINNIVDITNYVMLEYGQPMHAFDLKHVKKGKIIVRNATQGERIITLDGIERILSPEMLVIADAESPSAVAGVMGGEYSGIEEDTQSIVFESACFQGNGVRLTAKKLGMRSESSSRFEKGLDPTICPLALTRACQLVEELGAGEIVNGIIDIDHSLKEQKKIPFDPQWISSFIGADISRDEMVEYLCRLEVTIQDGYVIPPSFRSDLEHRADIAEEVARLYGYEKIPTTALRGLAEGKLSPIQHFHRHLSFTCLALGYSEIYTYTFISPKEYDKIALSLQSPLRNSVVISNPLGEDTSIMRTTALPSMLGALAHNYSNRNLDAALFELAMEFHPHESNQLPAEKPALLLGAYGKNQDFYTLKGAVEALLAEININGVAFTLCSDNPSYHPGRCAHILLENTCLGVLGEIHPEVCESYGIDTRVYVAQLDIETLFTTLGPEKTYLPLPRFPASTRDLAVTCDDSIPVACLEKIIRQKAGKLLERLELFDVYKGDQIPQGKKSVAYSLVLRAPDRTLKIEECDKVMNNIFNALAEAGASVRQ